MKISEFKNIIYNMDPRSGIVTVTINRPEIKNALALMVLYELYWAADAIENDPGAKAIVSSGYANDAILSNYRDFGFDGSVPKPYKVEELSRTLQQVLEQRG